jgi:hypothetical protein
MLLLKDAILNVYFLCHFSARQSGRVLILQCGLRAQSGILSPHLALVKAAH